MHLEDMTGVKLAEDVRTILGPRSEAKAPGFVLITSVSESTEAAGLSNAGLAIPLHKPFTPEQLIQVAQPCSGRRASDQTARRIVRGTTLQGKSLSSFVGRSPFEGKKVLIVDDSSAARCSNARYSSGLGFKDFVEASRRSTSGRCRRDAAVRPDRHRLQHADDGRRSTGWVSAGEPCHGEDSDCDGYDGNVGGETRPNSPT